MYLIKSLQAHESLMDIKTSQSKLTEEHQLQDILMKLNKIKQKSITIEEELIAAKRKAEIAEVKKCEAEEKAKKAEQDLYLFRKQAERDMANTFSMCEDQIKKEKRAMIVEENMLASTKDSVSDRAEIYKRALSETRDKLKIVEEELKTVQSRSLSAIEELQSVNIKAKKQNKMLKERADSAEDKLISVKKSVQSAEQQIQAFEQRIVVVEEELFEVNQRADQKIRQIKQQLQNSEEKSKSLETKLRGLHERVESTSREFNFEKDRADRAEKTLLAFQQAAHRNQLVLKESLEQANRESHEAVARKIKVEELLTNAVKQTKQREIDFVKATKRVEEVQKMLNNTEDKANKTEDALATAEKNHISCLAELQKKSDKLKKCEEQLKEVCNGMKRAEIQFCKAQTGYQNDITEMEHKACKLCSALNSETQEKLEVKNAVSVMIASCRIT